jgi:hypothetical protein
MEVRSDPPGNSSSLARQVYMVRLAESSARRRSLVPQTIGSSVIQLFTKLRDCGWFIRSELAQKGHTDAISGCKAGVRYVEYHVRAQQSDELAKYASGGGGSFSRSASLQGCGCLHATELYSAACVLLLPLLAHAQ